MKQTTVPGTITTITFSIYPETAVKMILFATVARRCDIQAGDWLDLETDSRDGYLSIWIMLLLVCSAGASPKEELLEETLHGELRVNVMWVVGIGMSRVGLLSPCEPAPLGYVDVGGGYGPKGCWCGLQHLPQHHFRRPVCEDRRTGVWATLRRPDCDQRKNILLRCDGSRWGRP